MLMLPHHNQDAGNGPVTVIVTRKAKQGKIQEFEEWMDGITHEAMKSSRTGYTAAKLTSSE